MDAPGGLDLLRRYFFYGWLFRDASVGTIWERAAALAHNRRHSHWLLTYIVRWLTIAAFLLAVGKFCEVSLASPLLSVPFYVFAVLTVSFNSVTVTCWALLRSGW